MSSLSGSEDAYRSLVEKGADGCINGLVAFAVLEGQRIEWMRHMESLSGCLPDSEQIREWYEQQPISALIRARAMAKAMLSEHVQATLKMPGDGSDGRKAPSASNSDPSQLSPSGMDPSPAKSAASRMLRDPARSKSATIAAELALGPRQKR